MKKLITSMVVGLALAGVATERAEAAFTAVFQGTTFVNGAGGNAGYEYTYNLVFQPQGSFQLNTNDFVQVNDFRQYVAASFENNLNPISLTLMNTGPIGVSPDDAAISNLQFVYTGPGTSSPVTYVVTLHSINDAGNLSASASRQTFQFDGTTKSDQVNPFVVTPLPEVNALLGLVGVGMVGFLGRRRRAAQLTV